MEEDKKRLEKIEMTKWWEDAVTLYGAKDTTIDDEVDVSSFIYLFSELWSSTMRTESLPR